MYKIQFNGKEYTYKYFVDALNHVADVFGYCIDDVEERDGMVYGYDGSILATIEYIND